MKVSLSEVTDALEMQFEELPTYLDLDNGEVHLIHAELLRDAEDGDDEEPDLPERQQRESARTW